MIYETAVDKFNEFRNFMGRDTKAVEVKPKFIYFFLIQNYLHHLFIYFYSRLVCIHYLQSPI